MGVKKIKLDSIRLDGGTQSRESIDQGVVTDYVDALRSDAQFPPITVFQDGQDVWLGDGFHRVAAMKQLGWKRVPADVKVGTLRDAILFSVGANAAHGLRRSNTDKRRAVTRLLQDEEWAQWSDREIASRCGVSNNFVSTLRRGQGSSLSSDDSEDSAPISSSTNSDRVYFDRHGNVSTMNTARIGRAVETFEDDDFDPFDDPEPPAPTDFAALRIQVKTDLEAQGLPAEIAAQVDGMDEATAENLADYVRVAKQDGDWLGIFEDWFQWGPKVSAFAALPDCVLSQTKGNVLQWIETVARVEGFDPSSVEEWDAVEADRAWIEIKNGSKSYDGSIIKRKTGRDVPEWNELRRAELIASVQSRPELGPPTPEPEPLSQEQRSLFKGLAGLLDQFGKQLRNVREHFESLTGKLPADRPEREAMAAIDDQIETLLNAMAEAADRMRKGAES